MAHLPRIKCFVKQDGLVLTCAEVGCAHVNPNLTRAHLC